MQSFAPVAILFICALIVCGVLSAISALLGPKVYNKNKLKPYECGVEIEGTARQPFQFQYYLVAVVFLLFDVEGAFFLPWALVYKESLATHGAQLFIGMLGFVFFAVVGLIYVLRTGVLKVD